MYSNNNHVSLNAFNSELLAYHSNDTYMSHPGIVQVIGAYQKDGYSFLVNELSTHGTL